MTKTKGLLLFFCFCTITSAKSQSFYQWKEDKRLSIIAGLGINNYYGELNDSHDLDPANYNLSIGLQYPLLSQVKLRAETMYYRISASDSKASSTYRQARNLSFRGQNIEFSLTSLGYLFPENFYNKPLRAFNPYLLVGIGFTYFNPEAHYNGKWYKLRPLKTEAIAYNQISWVVPIGLGLKYNIDNNMELMLECAYRFTNTDYLDDVSTTYKVHDPSSDPLAAALTDRGPEIGKPALEAGSPRGNPTTNDGYLTLNLKFSYKLGKPKPLRKAPDFYMY